MAIRDDLIAAVHREIAELAAADVELDSRPPRGRARGRAAGASVVYTLRLDAEEVAALDRRAALLGVTPSALARNFIRIGLSARGPAAMSGIVDRLENAVTELRALVP